MMAHNLPGDVVVASSNRKCQVMVQWILPTRWLVIKALAALKVHARSITRGFG